MSGDSKAASTHYAEQIAIVQERLEMLRDGRLSVREKTVEAPEWRDVTRKAIQQDEHVLQMLQSVLATVTEREIEAAKPT